MPNQPTDYELKMLNLQMGMRHNQTQMQDTFKDLDSWTQDIKVKEKKLLNDPDSIKNQNKGLPPIRSLATTKKKKKVKKTTDEDNQSKKNSAKKNSALPRDARAWDKLDVDKMCEDVDNHKSSESEYTTDEEWEEEQKKIRANWEKERGNQFFKDSMLNEAINCYTHAINLDPENAVYPANRAMCLIKQEKYAAAEIDCSISIDLDPKYAKAYHRRATCRQKLVKYELAKKDYEALLKIEPNNRLAQVELNQVIQLIDSRQLVFPVVKKEQDKSTKKLKRIFIEEINDESSERVQMEKKQELMNQRLDLNTEEKKLFDVKTDLKKEEPTEVCERVENITISKSKTAKEKELAKPVNVPEKKIIIPDAPSNGYQFKKDWQLLSKNFDDLSTYFKKISPKQYVSLFMNGLESEYLSKILLIFKKEYFDDHDALFLHLKSLSLVKRFKTQLMFLSGEDLKVIKELLDHLNVSKSISKADLDTLKQDYTD